MALAPQVDPTLDGVGTRLKKQCCSSVTYSPHLPHVYIHRNKRVVRGRNRGAEIERGNKGNTRVTRGPRITQRSYVVKAFFTPGSTWGYLGKVLPL